MSLLASVLDSSLKTTKPKIKPRNLSSFHDQLYKTTWIHARSPFFPLFQQKWLSPLEEQSLHLCANPIPSSLLINSNLVIIPSFFSINHYTLFPDIPICVYLNSLKKQTKILFWPLYPPLGITPFLCSLHSQILLKWFKKKCYLHFLPPAHALSYLPRMLYSIHSSMTSASITATSILPTQ